MCGLGRCVQLAGCLHWLRQLVSPAAVIWCAQFCVRAWCWYDSGFGSCVLLSPFSCKYLNWGFAAAGVYRCLPRLVLRMCRRSTPTAPYGVGSWGYMRGGSLVSAL